MHYGRWRAHGDPGEAASRRLRRAPGQTCAIEECDRPVLARGWCQKHYSRWLKTRGTEADIGDRRYQPITGGPCSVVDCDGVVVAKGLCSRHYRNQRNIAWRSANPEKYRDQHLSRYGIRGADYDAILASQDGMCPICHLVLDVDRSSQGCVDHDHQSGAVRGILCVTCNAGIGSLRDDVANLERAIEYLRYHQPTPYSPSP